MLDRASLKKVVDEFVVRRGTLSKQAPSELPRHSDEIGQPDQLASLHLDLPLVDGELEKAPVLSTGPIWVPCPGCST